MPHRRLRGHADVIHDLLHRYGEVSCDVSAVRMNYETGGKKFAVLMNSVGNTSISYSRGCRVDLYAKLPATDSHCLTIPNVLFVKHAL